MEVEIRVPVQEFSKLAGVLMENGFENMLIRKVPLSKEIGWTNVKALQAPPTETQVLTRRVVAPVRNASIKTEEPDVLYTPRTLRSNVQKALPPPLPSQVSSPFDIFTVPEQKVGLKQQETLSFNVSSVSQSMNSSRRATKKMCNLCGIIKKSNDDIVKHYMIHNKLNRFQCSQCGVLRKNSNFHVHFRKVCLGATVIDRLHSDFQELLEKANQIFTDVML